MGTGTWNLGLETSRLTQHTSDHLTHHTSHLTPNASHLTLHTSHLTPHTSVRPRTPQIDPTCSHMLILKIKLGCCQYSYACPKDQKRNPLGNVEHRSNQFQCTWLMWMSQRDAKFMRYIRARGRLGKSLVKKFGTVGESWKVLTKTAEAWRDLTLSGYLWEDSLSKTFFLFRNWASSKQTKAFERQHFFITTTCLFKRLPFWRGPGKCRTLPELSHRLSCAFKDLSQRRKKLYLKKEFPA